MKQNDAPVALPNQVLVGTSRYGDRKPSTRLPNSSTTGTPSTTLMGAQRGGGTPSRPKRSRLARTASKKMLLGNRLRGPSLHAWGGTARPARTVSSGGAECVGLCGGGWAGRVVERVGGGVAGPSHLVVAVLVGWVVAVGAPGSDPDEVVGLRHHVD